VDDGEKLWSQKEIFFWQAFGDTQRENVKMQRRKFCFWSISPNEGFFLLLLVWAKD
jgi:hypothetical protein